MQDGHPSDAQDPWESVYPELFFEGERRLPYLQRFYVLIACSTAIAALGLIQNSTAVVIGAMLVAPLMLPILALSAAMIRGWMGRQVQALATITGGMLLAIAFAATLSAVASGGISAADLPREVLSRTAPNLLDLGIAIAAGAAGAYVLMHREGAAVLPGVGIAVALLPPLATVGICLQLAAYELAWGAFLLFLTNLFAIILAASLVFLGGGMGRAHWDRAGSRVKVSLVATLALVAMVMVPLGIATVRVIADQHFKRAVIAAIDEWDPRARIEQLRVDDRDGHGFVSLRVSGAGDPEPAWRLAELVHRRTGRPVDVQVDYLREHSDVAVAR